MFKNLTIYAIVNDWRASLPSAESKADGYRFVECGPTVPMSIGWIEPRGQKHGALVESIGGQWIMKVMIEKRVLPASVVKRETEKRLKKYEEETGHRAGKKMRKDIKEQVTLELLPKAFTKQESVAVWIDAKNRLVVMDVGSQSKADDISTLLVETLEGIGLALLDTSTSPATAMATWLRDREAPAGFSIDRDCELKATDEGKAAVKYSHHGLDTEEVRSHLEQGKLPTKLAMTWDDRVSFILDSKLQVKKLDFLDVVFEGQKGSEKDDPFDANVAICTGELTKLLPDLIAALGGQAASESSEEEKEPEEAAA